MHSHSSCLIFQNLSFMWVIILTGQQQDASVSAKHMGSCSSSPAGHRGISEYPRKKCGLFESRKYSFILQVPNMRKTTCAFSCPPWEAAPGDNIIPKYRVELCLGAAELSVRTPATFLVPETLIWVVGSSTTHLGCPKSAVTKIKTWLTLQEN